MPRNLHVAAGLVGNPVIGACPTGPCAAGDADRDILHVAVVERHHGTGNIGKAFLGGFGLKRGAIASSVAHDVVVVVGADPEDMALAAGRVAEMDGERVLTYSRN